MGRKGIIYNAFGLNWHSDILSIPELYKSNEYNIHVSIKTAINNLVKNKSYLQVSNQDSTFYVQNLAKFRILNNNKIINNNIDKKNNHLVRSYLLGTAMAGILTQRNLLLLHANALEKEGKVIICMGKSGIGKSTISYLLMKKGWKLLSDDLVAIDDNHMVLPGIPRIKLWKDTIDAFKLDITKLKNLPYYKDKFVIDRKYIKASFSSNKLSEVYYLDNGINFSYSKPLKVENATERMLYLKRNIYRPELIKGMKNEYSFFLKLTDLAKKLPLYIMNIPRDLFILKKIINENFD